ncbi:MAG TPA: multidrug effflux MFS transporter [Xanthomonadales bacterium]|nr:multidrug effflux MFS transporter [Xanthomonadales bacterium]
MATPARTRLDPVPLAVLLALLAMFGPFTIDAFFPAFHAVQRELGASAWQMQQTISVYLVAYAVMSLFHGPVSDAIGRRRVILVGVVGFLFASIGCALSRTITQLLVFRALQGVFTGAGLIVGRAIVRDLYDGPQAQKVMSMITLFFGVAPALAPVIGGFVFRIADWHAVFWFLALYGAALLLLCLRVLPETHPVERRTAFRAAPLLSAYKDMALDGRFLLLAFGSGFNFGAFFLYISSAPAFVEHLLGLGTMGYAWFFVPCIAGMMTGAALSNRFAGRIAPRRTVAIGYAIMGTAMAINLAYDALVPRLVAPWAVLPIALNSVGISLAFPTLSIKMLDRFPRNRGTASSLQAFIWGLMTGAIAGVLSPLLSHSGMTLAIGAAAMMASGLACWAWYAAITPVSTLEKPVNLAEETVEPV